MMDFTRMLYPFNDPDTNWVYNVLGLVFILTFFDFRKWRCLRNLDVLMLCVWVPLGYYELGHLYKTMPAGYVPLFYFLGRLVYQVWRKASDECTINVRPAPLIAATVVLFSAGCYQTMVYPKPFGLQSMSDSAEGGMAGARKMLEGVIPYGHLEYNWDTYPPVYYYAYVPFELLFSDGKPITEDARLYMTYGLSARMLTSTLNLVSILALFWLGSRLRDRHFGAALAFGWAILPYTFMSTAGSQTGHLMPGALSIVAALGLSLSPTLGAVSLAVLAAAAMYPVLFAPLWAAAQGLRGGIRFLLVNGAVGLVLTVPMLMQEFGLQVFLEATLGAQDDPTRYSIWDQHRWTQPFKTAFMYWIVPFVAWSTWAAWRRGFVPVLALTGAVLVFEQLSHTHAPGRYHLWMMPFLMPVLLLGSSRARFERQA